MEDVEEEIGVELPGECLTFIVNEDGTLSVEEDER